jgi:hypothetical protein
MGKKFKHKYRITKATIKGEKFSLRRSPRQLIRIAEARNLNTRHLLALVEPAGQLAIDEGVDHRLMRPEMQPVDGSLPVALEPVGNQRSESFTTYFSHVFPTMTLHGRFPAFARCSAIHSEAVAENGAWRNRAVTLESIRT